MAGGERRKVPVWAKQVNGMECRRCKRRHSADSVSADDRRRLHARTHLKNQVLREGVAKWTFPARRASRPTMPLRRESSSWRPGHTWNIQVEQSLPDDIEGVVPEELRQRIERILAFPTDGGTPGADLLSVTPPTPNGHMEPTRTPAGGLLQEYLDNLDPDEEDELMFTGSDSDDPDDDLLFDTEKETYTTPYLLFVQQSRSRRRDYMNQSHNLSDDLLQNDDSKNDGHDDAEGRDGARGRTGHRTNSSVVDTTRTTTSVDPATTKDDHDVNAEGGSSRAVPDGGANTGALLSSVRQEKEDDTGVSGGSQEEEEEEEEEEDEEDDEEEDEENATVGEEGTKDGGREKGKKKKLAKKKKSKKKKKKKKSTDETNGGGRGDEKDEGERAEGGDSAEERMRKNVEKLQKSIALSLFRDFAKSVFAKEHPNFKLFEGFEDLPEDPRDSED